MEDRIRQVEREEREKFLQLERVGITQAQVLLKKMWQLNQSQEGSNPSSASSSSSGTPIVTPPNTPADTKRSVNTKKSDLLQTEPSLNKDLSKPVEFEPKISQPKSLTTSLGVFDFDEEFGNEQKELSVDENDEEDDLINYEQEKKRAPSSKAATSIIPASLPLPIPKQLASRPSHTTPTEEEFVEPPHIYSRTIQASTYIDYDTRPTRKKINLI
eukprot:TRINITY_DN2272_c0_g1_i1.p1 TRINITY_DN2272_c0_g1~~TRINITY_DN2272_c0_g1_i1.p1  ORF type:complete len:215 (-),score=42.71 TRINITY_DN2272_c0_g1_i1:59-703(-)